MVKTVSAAILLAVCIGGCSSFRTTAIDRTEHDTVVVNPTAPLKGIPVTVRVPTHLELSIIETTYWEKKNFTGEKPTLVRLTSGRPTRTVLHNIQETEKVFLVDPMRPGAGTQSYGFNFRSTTSSSGVANVDAQGKGYLSGLTYKVDDRTITESANLLANSLGMIQALQTSVANPSQNPSNLIATDRAIAFARFDINSPNYECDVADFLEQYLNCSPTTVCPQVREGDHCIQTGAGQLTPHAQ